MKISIIIPVKPGGYVKALEALQRFDADSPDHEVIIAEGKRPSRQRNLAAREATGDILYFLDDDSLPEKDALKLIVAAFSDSNVAAVGGPSITPSYDSPFQRAVGRVLTSTFGGGGVKNRYRKTGQLRRTDDSELILCNLAFRKDVYQKFGGLDERLYPNEENELMDRVLASGMVLLHDPDLAMLRSQRATPRAYVRQMLTYGRGRGEQTLISGRLNAKAVIPALFAIYILSLPLACFSWLYLLPLSGYLLLAFGNALAAIAQGEFAVGVRMPPAFFVLHFFYGIGFLLGLASPRYGAEVAKSEVQLLRVKEFSAVWSNRENGR